MTHSDARDASHKVLQFPRRPVAIEPVWRSVGFEPMLGPKDIAAVLGCSVRTAQRMLTAQEIPSARFGRRQLLRTSPAVLRDYIARNLGVRPILLRHRPAA